MKTINNFLKSLWQWDSVQVSLVFFGSRVLILLLGVTAAALINQYQNITPLHTISQAQRQVLGVNDRPTNNKPSDTQSNLEDKNERFSRNALNPATVWDKFDVEWYNKIATSFKAGKLYQGALRNHQVAFMPLYPVAVGTTMSVFNTNNFFLVGALLSNAFSWLAIYLIYRDLKTRITQNQRIWFLVLTCLASGAFYLSIPYGESLSLLLLAVTYVLLNRQKYLPAALVAGVAVLSRVQLVAGGWLALIPILFGQFKFKSKVLYSTLVLALFALPLLAYMIYLNNTFGDPLAFLNAKLGTKG